MHDPSTVTASCRQKIESILGRSRRWDVPSLSRSCYREDRHLYPRKPLMAPIGPPTHNVPCDPGTSLRLKAIARELGPTWTLTRVEAVAARLMAKHFKIEDEVEAAVASYQAGERKRRRLDLEVEPRHIEAIKRLESGRGAA